jgi:DNA (cytosine-5)-methyltransferase 1
LLLDLFCGAGGCSVGYHRAGFDVVGVDHLPQPRYPFEFIQLDAVSFLDGRRMDRYAAIHASPPCQVYSAAKRIGNARPGHKDLVAWVRLELERIGLPWVIENVPGAPLHFPIELCGTQFGLRLRRHRLFESSAMLFSPPNPCRHQDGDYTVFGHCVQLCGSRGAAYKDASGRTHYRPLRRPLKEGQEAMGIDWMNRAELSQAIPPAYTHHIGLQLLNAIGG